jgi:hypothetical protein
MLTRALTLAVLALGTLVVYQYRQIGELRTELTETQKNVLEARSMVADSMQGESEEIQRVLAWLNDFYKSPEGLQRPNGLCIDGQPDYVGIGTWAFDIYVRSRLKGLSEEEARRTIESAIKQSAEWRARHRVEG